MPTEPQPLAEQVFDLLAQSADLCAVTDTALRDELAGCQRAAQMLLARSATAMAEMSRRAHHQDQLEEERLGRPLWSSETRAEFVADEIAVTLTCTKAIAARQYAVALGAMKLPSVMQAWASGRIDDRKVAVITDGLAAIDPAFVDAVAQSAADHAATHTAPQLRTWLARRVIAADPGAAEVRQAQATAGRRVTVTPLPDGVSEFTALLPSVQARQIYETVNSIANAAGSHDYRTMDQRRADSLIDLLVGRAEPPQVQVHLLVSADTLLQDSDHPGHVPGIGPVAPSTARQLAMTGAGDAAGWRQLVTDPESGRLLDSIEADIVEKTYRPSRRLERAVRSRDVTCRFPGCRRPAVATKSGTDLDHTVPWPTGPTHQSNLAALCRHHHRVKHSPGWTVTMLTEGRLEWTTPGGRTFTTHPWTYADPPIP